MPELDTYIVHLKGVLTPEECKAIIDLYVQDDILDFWGWAKTTEGLDLSQRKVRQIYISDPGVLKLGPSFVDMDRRLFEIFAGVKDRYCETIIEQTGRRHYPDITSDEGYHLLHYTKGYYFHEHTDDATAQGRVLTCTLNLSDRHEGGIFRFFNGALDFHLGAGDAILFPASFMFPHEVTEITEGERHSIVTWFR